MSSFSKLAVFPVGYFRASTSWLLRNSRSIPARIRAINAELGRIGLITVTYRTEEKDGSTVATEDRVGFSVTKNSSLERLCRAYIANGGNPLDISPFLSPDSVSASVEPDGSIKIKEHDPHGGIIAPKSANPNDPLPKQGETTGFEHDTGGYVNSDGYYPGRQGGRVSRGSFDSDSIVKYMHNIRSWANQDIKERLQEIEARIIKLCDLREQLMKERDEVLIQAFGGTGIPGVGPLDESQFPGELRVQSMVQDMYGLLYETKADGTVQAFRGDPKKIGLLQFTFDDVSSELRFPLG